MEAVYGGWASFKLPAANKKISWCGELDLQTGEMCKSTTSVINL